MKKKKYLWKKTKQASSMRCVTHRWVIEIEIKNINAEFLLKEWKAIQWQIAEWMASLKAFKRWWVKWYNFCLLNTHRNSENVWLKYPERDYFKILWFSCIFNPYWPTMEKLGNIYSLLGQSIQDTNQIIEN